MGGDLFGECCGGEVAGDILSTDITADQRRSTDLQTDQRMLTTDRTTDQQIKEGKGYGKAI